MKVTRKELKTEIHVEITREEFCENYQLMMTDIINHVWDDSRVNVNTINNQLKKFNDGDEEIKNNMAQESFTALFGLIHDATIRYTAQANGLKVENYGFYNRFTDCIESVFYINGEHL